MVRARQWKVFKAWTSDKLFAGWWGANDVVNSLCKIDATRGGEIFVDMKLPDGKHYIMKGNFHLIDDPEQLIFTTNFFQNDEEHPTVKLLNTVIFLPENYNTRITLQSVVMHTKADTQISIEQLEQWWNESLDKLEHLMKLLRFSCFSIAHKTDK